MPNIILVLIIGGGLALALMPVVGKRSRIAAYALMVVLPLCTLGLYLTFIPLPSTQITREQAPPSPSQIAVNTQDEATLQKAVNDAPDNLKAALDLGGYYVEQDQYKKALETLSAAEKHHPAHADIALQRTATIFARGLHEAENQDYETALDSLWDARKIAPEGTPFLMDLDNFIIIISRQFDESEGRFIKEDKE